MNVLTVLVVLIGFGHSHGVVPRAPSSDSKRVMVVTNTASEDSKEVAKYYIEKRGIPRDNRLDISVSDAEVVPSADFESKILKPIRQKIASCPNRIDFIVLTKGTPIRLDDAKGCSVDSKIAGMNLSSASLEGQTASKNPFFNAEGAFDSSKYGAFLVCRLDGYTVQDAEKLVDDSILAKPEKGPFFFDTGAGAGTGSYGDLHRLLIEASSVLRARGFDAQTDQTAVFVAPREALAGYASWGSNDQHFVLDKYRSLKFKPGAIAETFVSFSGRTFKHVTGGQSVITDLIANGVTGVKGYVSEPYTFALAVPPILFDRYTKGMCLAESFYAASRLMNWKDLVIGDPICRPYGKASESQSARNPRRRLHNRRS